MGTRPPEEADGQVDRRGTGMTEHFLVIAYRWGWTNSHQYIVGCYEHEDCAVNSAVAEAYSRGGKYGCAVIKVKHDDVEQVFYAPSVYDEAKQAPNHRIDLFQAVGSFVVTEYERGDGPSLEQLVKEYDRAKKNEALMEALSESMEQQ